MECSHYFCPQCIFGVGASQESQHHRPTSAGNSTDISTKRLHIAKNMTPSSKHQQTKEPTKTKIKLPSTPMNPNANSFQGFRPGANTFVPGGAPPPGSSNPQQQQQQHPAQDGGSQPPYPGYYPGQGYGNAHPNYQQQGAHQNYGYHQQYHQPHHQHQQQQQYQYPGGYGAHQQYYQHPHQQPQSQYNRHHHHQQQQQQQAPDNWEEEAPPRPPTQQPQASSEATATVNSNGAKTLSISSTTRLKQMNANSDKPAVVSLNIGKKKDPAPAPVAKPATDSKVSSTARSQSSTQAKKVITIGSSTKSQAPTPPTESGTPDPPSADPVPASTPAVEATLDAATKTLTIGDARRPVLDADAIKKEVEAAVDEETLRDLYESKKDDVKEDGKPHANLVFIGHVDAGKSTMGGNILYLTGMVDKRTMEKLEKEAKDAGKESWYLSWALDSTIQERSQGKTVEIGRAYFETDARRYTILDAPGHKTYVPAMISGASQADIAILVISARKGEFETGFERGGQTREHAMLVKTTGVSKLVVVINKMDDITVEWDQARYDEIVNKLTPFLRLSGFNPAKDITFIPVSGYTGANIKDRLTKDKCSWYEGPSLLELLDNMKLTDRKYNAPLMMPISEKYKDMGAVVVGKLESGKVTKGESVLMMPNKTSAEVSAIYNEMEDEIPRALCGDNVRIRLKGIEDEDIMCGFVLTDAHKPIHTVTRFEAQLAIIDSKNIICAGYGAVMHVHTLAEECTLSALLHYYDKKTGKKSRRPPQFAKKGMKVVALLETVAPICVETFKDHPQLGRFTLRDEGKTIAIGKITKLLESANPDDPSSTKA
ncbi:peptide chain release factor eRF subunit 2 [Puccinia graminis f. sp. tritici CRL 75-36-700-3]|uniref:Eukaryotic peptide chain release factor GTP-binding subunit n=2 Tax=Puccinia graminis f. sp. tritici TaxID=56615 RepID=E3L7T7_PUCGT|nr:peptide chain release factor eRF subunit 2 [Puccinia graminis f. sp. tritici CRL 75-36-700-3]EFP92612.2 peptide chain release factor eRF subunit 2 [Puccinia graminis f. sp. tritici CRL 75-36-700-3]